MPVAQDAPVAAGAFGVIVISHGAGGMALLHRDLAIALASHGYVVAAPTHPRGKGDDISGVTVWVGRPKQVSGVIDAVLGDGNLGAHIERERIGVAGHSNGGYTALALANVTLFAGKAKVAKAIGPAGPQYPEFYVDEDWRIPIGYVFYELSSGHRETFLNVGFWYRGNPPTVEAHLFYKGKEVAKSETPGNEGSDWNPAKHQWGLAICQFVGVYKDDPGEEGYDPRFAVARNAGEYEVKVLLGHHLARSIKFVVNANGSFDNGVASANKLGSDRVIVPVQVIGDSPWDRSAWKTEALYGNPLTGFSVP